MARVIYTVLKLVETRQQFLSRLFVILYSSFTDYVFFDCLIKVGQQCRDVWLYICMMVQFDRFVVFKTEESGKVGADTS